MKEVIDYSKPTCDVCGVSTYNIRYCGMCDTCTKAWRSCNSLTGDDFFKWKAEYLLKLIEVIQHEKR